MIAIKFFIIAVDFGVLSTWKRYEKHSWTRHHEKIFIYVRAYINKDFVHSGSSIELLNSTCLVQARTLCYKGSF